MVLAHFFGNTSKFAAGSMLARSRQRKTGRRLTSFVFSIEGISRYTFELSVSIIPKNNKNFCDWPNNFSRDYHTEPHPTRYLVYAKLEIETKSYQRPPVQI